MQEYLRWAILGAGAIADEMARTLRAMGRYPYAVASRTHGNAVRFAETHRIPKVYSRIEEMFADPAVDAVYIASPHNTHAAYLRAALQSGKHVLCEKSVTLNSRELAEAMALAAENRVVLAEAMTIWHMPLYQKLGDLVQGGALGRVRAAGYRRVCTEPRTALFVQPARPGAEPGPAGAVRGGRASRCAAVEPGGGDGRNFSESACQAAQARSD